MPALFEPYNPFKSENGSLIPDWLMERPVKECSLGAKVIYARLKKFAGRNGVCFPKIEILSAECGLSLRQTNTYLKELKTLRLIKAIRVGKKCTNRYLFLWHPWKEDSMKMDCDVQDSAYHTNSDMQDSAYPMDVQDSAHPQKENQERESNISIVFSKKEKRDKNVSVPQADLPAPVKTTSDKSEPNKESNIRHFSKSNSKQKIENDIGEVYEFWKKEVKQPTWGLTKIRHAKIKSALLTGIKYKDQNLPLSVDQIKDLIVLHLKDQWWISKGLIDLTSILTQERMSAFIEKRIRITSPSCDDKPLNIYDSNFG